jgi:tripeptide aminopeptidase
MINHERIVSTFLEYVQIDSPTQSEGLFAKVMIRELEALGFEVYVDKAGQLLGSDTGNLIAKLKGTCDVNPILFSCHLDTASPGIGIQPIVKNDIIYSDGTTILGADNKAGIAALIEAIQVIKENELPHGPIEIVFSIFEEGYLKGSSHLDYSKILSKHAYVLDGGGDPGQIIASVSTKDRIEFIHHISPSQTTSGKSLSTKEFVSYVLDKINFDFLKDSDVNIIMREGGLVENRVQIDINNICTDQLKTNVNYVRDCFKSAAKDLKQNLTSHVLRLHQGYSLGKNDFMINKIYQACQKIGLDAFTVHSDKASDANNYHLNGIKAVNLGIGEKKCHTVHEHLHIKDLLNASRLIIALIQEHRMDIN